MESQPQNPEFRNNPEKFHPCTYKQSGGNNTDQRRQFVGYRVGVVRVTNTLVITEESSSEWLESQCVVG